MVQPIIKIRRLKAGNEMRVGFDYTIGNAVRMGCADAVRVFKNGSWTELNKHPISGEYHTGWIDKEPVKIIVDYSTIDEKIVKGNGYTDYYWTPKTL